MEEIVTTFDDETVVSEDVCSGDYSTVLLPRRWGTTDVWRCEQRRQLEEVARSPFTPLLPTPQLVEERHCTSPPLDDASWLVVGVKDTVPWKAKWAQCRHCSYAASRESRGRIRLHDPHGDIARTLVRHNEGGAASVLSHSKWTGFFHNNISPPDLYFDQMLADVVGEPFSRAQCARVIDAPVYFIHMITWQVGHMLVDVLEALYYMMVEEFGEVNRDAILVFQVAQRDEQAVLHHKILLDVFEGDTPMRLLRLFTRQTILTKAALDALPGRTCFSNLHLELDLSQTYYTLGFDRHPNVAEPHLVAADRQLAERYRQFGHFLLDGLGVLREEEKQDDGEQKKKDLTVTFVERVHKRRILNLESLVAIAGEEIEATADDGETRRVVLEQMDFSEQLGELRRADVVVSQYGSGTHNSLFLRPGASLILVMQPGWCDWRWPYANQAVLTGLHVFTYCVEAPEIDADEEHGFRWTHRGWTQGPWSTKDTDSILDTALFRKLLARAIRASTSWVADDLAVSRIPPPAIHEPVHAKPTAHPEVGRLLSTDHRRDPGRSPDGGALLVENDAAGDGDAEWLAPLPPARAFMANVSVEPMSDAASPEVAVNMRVVMEVLLQRRAWPSAHGFMQAAGKGFSETAPFAETEILLCTTVNTDDVANADKHAAGVTPVWSFAPEYAYGRTAPDHHPWMAEVAAAAAVGDGEEVAAGWSENNDSRFEYTYSSDFLGDDAEWAACYSHEAFNEHSTLDFRGPRGEHVLHSWLAIRDLASGGLRKIPHSDTFAVFDTEDPLVSTDRWNAGKTFRPDDYDKDVDVSSSSRGLTIDGAWAHVNEGVMQLMVEIDGASRPLFVPLVYSAGPSAGLGAYPHERVAPHRARAAIQSQVAAFCRDNSLVTGSCALLARHVFRMARLDLTRRDLELPTVQTLPSPTNPFVFLHHEKCGGTSLRRYIVRAARHNGLEYYVPCYDSVTGKFDNDKPCMRFNLRDFFAPAAGPSTARAGDGVVIGDGCEPSDDPRQLTPEERTAVAGLSVLGGHFEWGVWHGLPSIARLYNETGAYHRKTRSTSLSADGGLSEGFAHSGLTPDRTDRHVSCLTILREPVSRAISLYYERLYPHTQIALGDLSANDLAYYVENWYGSAHSRWRDEGLSDSFCKMLSGANAHKGRLPEEVREIPGGGCDLAVASQRLRRCVVGLQENWPDTKRVIAHWFPWLQFGDDVRGNTGLGSRAETPDQLPSPLLNILLRYNANDIVLYKLAEELFEKQLLLADRL